MYMKRNTSIETTTPCKPDDLCQSPELTYKNYSDSTCYNFSGWEMIWSSCITVLPVLHGELQVSNRFYLQTNGNNSCVKYGCRPIYKYPCTSKIYTFADYLASG